MKRVFALFIVMLFAGTAAAQVKWNFDAAHSNINFSVRHLTITDVTGNFGKFEGSVESQSEKDFTDAKISFTIDVSSINTGIPMRDDHLRSADFFDAEKHKNITFESTSMKKTGEGTYELQGNFTMRGKTHPITLAVTHNGIANDGRGNIKTGFTVSGQLNRQDYGVSWSKTLDTGGLMVDNIVKLLCNIQMVKL